MLIYLSCIIYHTVLLLWKTTKKSAVHFIQSPINREIIISWTETFLKSAVTFKWKWKGYIVNWVTRYQCYEMVFGDNQVCLPSSSCVHGLKLSFGRRSPEVCGGGQTIKMAGWAARRRLLRWEQHLIRLHLTPWLQALLKPTQLHSSLV